MPTLLSRKSKRKVKIGSSQRKTSSLYRDCAICSSACGTGTGAGSGTGKGKAESKRRAGKGRAAEKHFRDEPHARGGGGCERGTRTICYCDTNEDTLPLLSGNCYRSICTAATPENSCAADGPAPATFRCLNIDRNLRANKQCPCDTSPSSNGDHNFFFGPVGGIADLNNNVGGGSGRPTGKSGDAGDRPHVKVGDTCLRCCVTSTQPPPRLYCFQSATCCVSSPGEVCTDLCNELCSELSVDCTSSVRRRRRWGASWGSGWGVSSSSSTSRRRSRSASRKRRALQSDPRPVTLPAPAPAPAPQPLRNQKAIQPTATPTPRPRTSTFISAATSLWSLRGTRGRTGSSTRPSKPPRQQSQSQGPVAALRTIVNPLYRDAEAGARARAGPGPGPRPQPQPRLAADGAAAGEAARPAHAPGPGPGRRGCDHEDTVPLVEETFDDHSPTPDQCSEHPCRDHDENHNFLAQVEPGRGRGPCQDDLRDDSPDPSPDPTAVNLDEAKNNNIECHEDAVKIGPREKLPPNLFLNKDEVFENLTQLDVSENAIESLDLSALSKLQTLQCSRNCLRELSVNGRHLTSLIAGNNQLRSLTASPAPAQLEHLDVSYNRLASLPAWVSGCPRLRALFASHNELTALPAQLLGGQLPHLHTLQLSYNQLQQLPAVAASARSPLALHHLFLQSNRLAALPLNLFNVATRLRVLNVSNNRLEELVGPQEPDCPLDKLYLTANCLGDSALRSLAAFRRLRTLHAAYNHLSILPDSCIASWRDLEELVVSGNQLRHLPENIVQMRHLRVLRVHSNQLRDSPCFAKMSSLKVLDLSHNQLDRVSLAALAPPQLQFLDLSCNSRLHVDPRQFSIYRSQRSLSLVDVSGLNRSSLPTSPMQPPQTPWIVGFSETPGLRERLYISQLRLPSFCSSEGLFGLFDGGTEGALPAALVKAVPRILLEERAVTETASDYLKYTLLSAHRELREHGQRCGVCATLVHVSPRGARYVLRVASVGEARAVLARRDGPTLLTREPPANGAGANRHPLESAVRSQLGCSALFPLVLPDPHVVELELLESDDFLVLANKRLWEVVSEQEAVQEVRAASSPLLAAKRLQDMAQSYGCEDNISVLVLRLGDLTASVHAVVQELNSTIRRHSVQHVQQPAGLAPPETVSCACCAPCCRCRSCQSQAQAQSHPRHDRSSPSGQSDQASNESRCRPSPQGQGQGLPLTIGIGPATRGVGRMAPAPTSTLFKAVRCRVDNGYSSQRGPAAGVGAGSGGSDSGDTSGSGSGSGCGSGGSDRSHLSEEQFRCWEYMLEQNTQLLFDKELDTLSRAFTRRPIPRGLLAGAGGPGSTLGTLGTLGGGRALSSSSPHLASPATPAPFLSRHFGSARSLTCSLTPGPGLSSSSRRLGGLGLGSAGGARLLHTGPNAAYFGSLQRLMPYNLEYDFDVIHERTERGDETDSIEQDGRMRKYWDVATTEL